MHVQFPRLHVQCHGLFSADSLDAWVPKENLCSCERFYLPFPVSPWYSDTLLLLCFVHCLCIASKPVGQIQIRRFNLHVVETLIRPIVVCFKITNWNFSLVFFQSKVFFIWKCHKWIDQIWWISHRRLG